MNYKMDLDSVDNCIKKAKIIPNYYIESDELSPEINNKEYIFEIRPIGDEMFNMALCSKEGCDIQNLIESYCLYYDNNCIGIRDENYFMVRDMFDTKERVKNYIFLDYPCIPLYFLTKNLYLKVIVKKPILDLVLFMSIVYQVYRMKNVMMFKMYDYKVEKIPITSGINILNIVENKEIEFIVLKTPHDFNNISLEQGLTVTNESPSYYRYTVPYCEHLTAQKDMYLIPLSCNPLLMNKCMLILDSNNDFNMHIIFVSLVYLRYDKDLKNIYEVFSI